MTTPDDEEIADIAAAAREAEDERWEDHDLPGGWRCGTCNQWHDGLGVCELHLAGCPNAWG